MHPAAEGAASREETIAKVRALAAEHRAAFERLGATLDSDPNEVVVDWQNEWGPPFALFVPLPPSLLRAAVARLDELERSLDASLAPLTREEWDLRDGRDGWSVRMVVDHLAAGCALFKRRLEPWPLDPNEAQAAALEELLARVAAFDREDRDTQQFGLNVENRRVRWTARKVVRVVRDLQDAWLAFGASGIEPQSLRAHEDTDDDTGHVDRGQVQILRDQDAELRRSAREQPRLREIAASYRYYRDRLLRWPDDELERWRAARNVFREWLLALEEPDLARLRVAPSGTCTSIRQQLGASLGHLHEHTVQIARIRGAVTTTAQG